MDKMKKQTGVIWAVFVTVVALFAVCSFGGGIREKGRKETETAYGNEEPEKRDFFGMDTYITFTAYGDGAEEALKEAENRMAWLESLWAVTDKDSDIYKVNHSGGLPVTVSKETAEAVSYALEMAKKTAGALEPTIYPVLTALT